VSFWTESQGAGLERALETARQAVRLDERNSLALWAFAMIAVFTRRNDEAASAGKKGVAVNPNHAEAHTVLGVTGSIRAASKTRSHVLSAQWR
jgi:hypothetical protein